MYPVITLILYLEYGHRHPLEVGHPEPLLPARAQRRPDGVLEDLVHAEVRQHARLVVRDAEVLGHGATTLGQNQVLLSDLPGKVRNVTNTLYIRSYSEIFDTSIIS